MRTHDSQTVHGTCVALGGRGLLLIGASGSGKSSLALSLMAMGATLVSDDRVVIKSEEGMMTATAPTGIEGLIEARGVGILTAKTLESVSVAAVVDMDRVEAARLPAARQTSYLGTSIPLLHKVDAPHFAAALLQFLKSGRHAPT